MGTITQLPAYTSCRPVHPHGRGDNRGALRPGRAVCGSPPRAWGQCSGALRIAGASRFTPTGVGTMRKARARRSATSVHPHGRGDNDRRCCNASADHGSPPRAWGQCQKAAPVGGRPRFTPTGVGTIGGRPDGCTARTVHPHGRGDNDSSARVRRGLNGSPPRAWGQFIKRIDLNPAHRFTPTGVGTMTDNTRG